MLSGSLIGDQSGSDIHDHVAQIFVDIRIEGRMILRSLMKNTLFQNTGVYTLTSIINSSIPFFLLPLLTRYLTPQEYGIVSMFSLLVSIAAPFIGISISGAIARQYYNREELDLWSYVFNGFLILITNTIIVGLVFYVFSEPISRLSSFPSRYLWMVIVYVMGQVIVSVLLSLWQVQKKAKLYGIFINLQTLVNLILSIIFVVFLRFGWVGRIYGQLVAVVMFAAAAVVVIYHNRWIKLTYNKEYIKHALMFGIPLIPHALSGSIISMTDRFFITSMVGLAATGVYTVGYQVGSIINLLASSFNNAYVPWLYERLKKNESSTKIKIVKLTYLYFIGVVLFAIVFGLAAPSFLGFFLGKSFSESSIFVIWVALGYAFNGMYLMVVNYIFYAQKNSLLAMVTFVTAIINIILNYFFIKVFGAIGAAQATTVVFVIKFIMVWILSAKVYKMPWNIFKNVETNNN